MKTEQVLAPEQQADAALANRRILYLVPDAEGVGGIARQSRAMRRALLESGADVRLISLPPGRGRSRQVRFALRALRSLTWKPDLVIAAHPNLSPLAWLAARLSGSRCAVVCHGVDAWSALPPLRRWSLRRSDRVIAVSRFTAGRVAAANGIAAEKIDVLPNCLDPAIKPEDVSRPDDAPPVLLTVGRLDSGERYKGHDQVIRCLPALLPRFPGLVYEVVGDGDDRARLEALCRTFGLERAVRFHGIVSEEALRDCYRRATLFVMPSRGEGFGMVYLEAMAHGLPIIASTADAGREVVRHGETGLLVDPDRDGELADAVVTLLEDAGLRRRLDAAGLRVVTGELSFPTFRRRLVDCVRALGESS